MHELRGIPASPGIAIGPVFIFTKPSLEVKRGTIADSAAEIDRFREAVEASKQQIEIIRIKALNETTEEEAAIFEAHALFLDDPELLNPTCELIEREMISAEGAFERVVENLVDRFESLQDEYFRARAADVKDVGQRVLRNLMGVGEADFSALQRASIIVADDLAPSDTVLLDKSLVLGFCTAKGGPSSHTAILAKALGVPAVVGAGVQSLSFKPDSTLILDGTEGTIIVDPNKAVQSQFMARKTALKARSEKELASASDPAITSDGHQVEIVANVGSIEEAQSALEYGAEGIGLLRTEFLYLDQRTAPDEEQQLQAYGGILSIMGNRPVIVRTLDVGGDKELPYIDLGIEANPFLGWRAIRMCLDEVGLFKTQLRALLRAGPGHDLRIMFPMIATLGEVARAKDILHDCEAELVNSGHELSKNVQIGIMVEVPSAALLADQFAPEVDFFSIGTNDLTQYTMAAERTNEKVAHLGDACHPAILRLIDSVIRAAHANGIWAGVCGELAGDEDAIPILLGLGLDEFSMAPRSIPRAKGIIRRWSLADAGALAGEVLDLRSAEAVRLHVRETAALLDVTESGD